MSSDLPIIDVGEQPLAVELPPRPPFARRIQRAHELAERYPSAAEVLRFYTQLAFHQEHLFDSLRATIEPGALFNAADPWPLAMDLLLSQFHGFAIALAEISPFPMSTRATELAMADSAEQTQLLASVWANSLPQDPTSAADRCLALSFLQPYAELLASVQESPSPASSGGTCPVCASEPVCAVLRDRVHGAGRSLVCSLCMHEWSFPRAVCPACGEERFEALPVFTSDHMPNVRIDACENCRHYIKTIDMTKDGLAVPVVDEMAAVSLDLWAVERQYRKLAANLLSL